MLNPLVTRSMLSPQIQKQEAKPMGRSAVMASVEGWAECQGVSVVGIRVYQYASQSFLGIVDGK